MRRADWAAVLALIGLAVWAAYSPAVTLNYFILPEGYRGPVVIVSHPSFRSRGRWERDDRYLHVVPTSGIVCVETTDMLRGFLLAGAYWGGAPLYSYGEGLPSPPDASSMRIEGYGQWGGNTEGSHAYWFGVGDARETEALRGDYFADRIASKLPVGAVLAGTDESFEHVRRFCR